jgi:hypothetical protein
VSKLTIRHSALPLTSFPGSGHPGKEEAPEAALSASYRYDTASHQGTIRLVNNGDGGVPDWAVTLRVPGAETVSVTSGAVSVFQTGSIVSFQPADGPVAAGESVSFGFALDDDSAGPPDGCAVDGIPCSG